MARNRAHPSGFARPRNAFARKLQVLRMGVAQPARRNVDSSQGCGASHRVTAWLPLPAIPEIELASTARQRDTLDTAASETPAAPATPFDRIGGHETLRAIADRFYDLMESEPGYAKLRAIHADDLTYMRGSLASFLAGWAGGPRDWFEANPGKCMMSMHAPFAISKELAAQWATCIQRAIRDVNPADTEVAGAMSDVLFRMAMGMARD